MFRGLGFKGLRLRVCRGLPGGRSWGFGGSGFVGSFRGFVRYTLGTAPMQ